MTRVVKPNSLKRAVMAFGPIIVLVSTAQLRPRISLRLYSGGLQGKAPTLIFRTRSGCPQTSSLCRLPFVNSSPHSLLALTCALRQKERQ